MKAITLWQPWASLIMFGPKRVENRTWRPKYTDLPCRLAIHAGAKEEKTVSEAVLKVLEGMPPAHWNNSAILGTALLTTIVHSAEDLPEDQRMWFVGPIGWVLEDIRPLRFPLPCKGAQGLWTLPDDIFRKLKVQSRDTQKA